MRLVVPFGTRPEIVKLAPVLEALGAAGHETWAVSTGQHDAPLLADAFLDDLGLRPDETWELPGDEAVRVGAILEHAYRTVDARGPDAVVVLGDTHTVALFGLAARRFGVPVVHLEAGLRSFNARSLEEVNRRVVAAMASLHLAPTELAARFLRDEAQPPARIRVVGNPVTDTLARWGPPPCPVEDRHGIVVTAHRATNVDDPDRLARLVELVRRLAVEVAPVRFPVHPRTRHRLDATGLTAELAAAPGVVLEEPLRYAAMLDAVAGAQLVVTDSGGLQEEASWLGVPLVVLRGSTPRWEGVVNGTAALVGLDVDTALSTAMAFAAPDVQARVAATPCPYGDGRVGPRVAALLADPEIAALLTLDEPPVPSGKAQLPPGVAQALEA